MVRSMDSLSLAALTDASWELSMEERTTSALKDLSSSGNSESSASTVVRVLEGLLVSARSRVSARSTRSSAVLWSSGMVSVRTFVAC